MADDVDEVGLEAVIRGIATYAANAGKIVTSNTAINKSLAAVAKGAALFRKALATAMKIGAIAVVAGLAASINVFKNFDQAMTESIAIMGDVSAAMRKDMELVAREVAKSTTFSMTEAAESYFFLASAGLSAAQSMAALPQVARFAQAGMFDMALATDLLTDAQSALGLISEDTVQNIENMARVSDVLVKANTLANATVEQFSTSLTREAGAALKTFGKDVEEGVAVLAAFADQGVKGQLAGTSLSRILRLMGSAAVNNAKAYDQLGIAVFDANNNMRNIGDIIADLEVALLDLSDADRIAALETLGFQARVQGVILPLLGTSDAIKEYEKNLRSAGGITDEVAEKQLRSLSAQFSLLRSAIEDVLFTIGQALEPALRGLVRVLRDDLIPWIEIQLPKAIALAEKGFKDWKPVIEESGRVLQDLGRVIKDVFNFVINNQAAMVAAIVAIGFALAAWNPIGAAMMAAGGIIFIIALFRTDLGKLSIGALEARVSLLKLSLAAVEGLQNAQNMLSLGVIPLIEKITGDAIFATRGVNALNDSIAETNSEIQRMKNLQFIEELQGIAIAAQTAAEAFFRAATNAHLLTQQLVRMGVARAIAEGFVGMASPAEVAAALDRLNAEMIVGPPGPLGPTELPPGFGGGGPSPEDLADEAARLFIEALIQGVRDGTVGVVEAINFLKVEMIEAASAIIDELLAIAESSTIVTDIIARGFIELADIARLVQLGQIDTAIAVAQAFAGVDSPEAQELLDAIANARKELLRPFFPTARISAQHGAFIPPGQITEATLHGGQFGEVVVPLGSNTMALRALTAAVTGVPGGGGEGFRNYGTVQVIAADDRDRGVMRSMRRALGA